MAKEPTTTRQPTQQTVEPDFRSVFRATLSPLAVLDSTLRIVAVNDAYCRLFASTPTELVGRVLFERFPDQPESFSKVKVQASLERVLKTGRADALDLLRYDVEEPGQPGAFAERYWSITNFPVASTSGSTDFVAIHPEEVTTFLPERMRQIAGGAPTVPAALARAVDTVFDAELDRLQLVTEFSEAMVKADTIDQVARTVVTEGLRLLGAQAGSYIALRNGRFRIIADRAIEKTTAEAWSEFEVAAGREPFSDALLTREPLFFETRAAMLDAYPHLSDAIERDDHQAWAVLPIIVDGSALGAIGVVFDHPTSFETANRLTLIAIRDLAGQATSRALLIEEQSRALASLQRLFATPIDPNLGVEVSSLYEPASQLIEAGGDFYDLFATDRGLVLFIGDVADHGPGIAAEMVRSLTTLQNKAMQYDEPWKIAHAAAISLAQFATTHTTACIATYEPTSRRLTWTSAGHPYPVVRDRNGEVTVLAETHGPPLGVGRASSQYTQSERVLAPGDTVVFYTDGLIEHRSKELDEAIADLAEAVGEVEPNDFAENLFRRLIPSGIHHDDVAILSAIVIDDRPHPGGG